MTQLSYTASDATLVDYMSRRVVELECHKLGVFYRVLLLSDLMQTKPLG